MHDRGAVRPRGGHERGEFGVECDHRSSLIPGKLDEVDVLGLSKAALPRVDSVDPVASVELSGPLRKSLIEQDANHAAEDPGSSGMNRSSSIFAAKASTRGTSSRSSAG